jgi:hypothetical protein
VWVNESDGMTTPDTSAHFRPSPDVSRRIAKRRQEWRRIIEGSLERFDEALSSDGWLGRENEVVNRFAHEYLYATAASDLPLYSLRQIGIEVAVPQVTPRGKAHVRKDLVLWRHPLHNPWHLERPCPAAIIEWKAALRASCHHDIEWLRCFTRRFPDTIGYSARAFVWKGRGVAWVRIERGNIVATRSETGR